jgi:hypothetical protein
MYKQPPTRRYLGASMKSSRWCRSAESQPVHQSRELRWQATEGGRLGLFKSSKVPYFYSPRRKSVQQSREIRWQASHRGGHLALFKNKPRPREGRGAGTATHRRGWRPSVAQAAGGEGEEGAAQRRRSPGTLLVVVQIGHSPRHFLRSRVACRPPPAAGRRPC